MESAHEKNSIASDANVSEEQVKQDIANQNKQSYNDGHPPACSGKGGPRTKLGKARSSRNALTHGLCTKVLLLEGESPIEFAAFLEGFRQYFRPVGLPEDVCVRDMTWSKWCIQRASAAERAEVALEKRYNSRSADRERKDKEELAIIEASLDAPPSKETQTSTQGRHVLEREISTETQISNSGPTTGLIAYSKNPVIRARCIELLKTLHRLIELGGFIPAKDRAILNKIFGGGNPHSARVMYESYNGPVPNMTPEECKTVFLGYLQGIIDIEEGNAGRAARSSALRKRLESMSSVVPEAPRLDRLLRYRASLERDFDRTLNQLERLQRIRKGQPVPPTLNVNVSS
jgi:hypothetical protein